MTRAEPGGRIVLGQNNYGKSEIRLVKVKRDAERHELWDIHVRVALEGDFDAAHYGADNTRLLATDTMRNTVYALARDGLTGSIEDFGLVLVDHFLEAGPTVTSCRIELTQFPWSRIEVNGEGHDHAFVRGRGERKATVRGDTSGARRVEAGMDDVYVMKTTASGWERFYREEYTTLPETDDRILATVVTARWWYSTTDADFDELHDAVMARTLETFTDHYSPSAQHTLYRMGETVLQAVPEVERIWYSLPNVHHVAYDLERFGMANDGEVFHATQDPYGQIEGHVERET